MRESIKKRKSERERESERGGQSERESERERDLFDLNRSCVNFDYAVSFVQRFRVIRCQYDGEFVYMYACKTLIY